VAEEKKKRRKKRRGHPVISGPQFATHVFGGGYYLGPGYLGYSTAQADADDGAAEGGGEGGT
jgi:hypothetical protein